jgi:hypothetical protein
VISESENLYHFQGKYHILNNTNITYQNVDVTLVDQRLRTNGKPKSGFSKKKLSPSKNASTGFKSNRRSSYEMDDLPGIPSSHPILASYQLKNPVDLPPGETTVVFTQGIIQPINKHYLLTFPTSTPSGDLIDNDKAFSYSGNGTSSEVLEVQNLAEHGLGLALPAGKLNVSWTDVRSNAHTNVVSHHEGFVSATEENEFISLTLGTVDNVVGNRSQQSFTNSHGSMSESITVKVSNRSNLPVNVLVEDSAYRWHNWKVTTPTPNLEFHPNGKHKVRWYLQNIQPNAEEAIQYTMQYDYAQN